MKVFSFTEDFMGVFQGNPDFHVEHLIPTTKTKGKRKDGKVNAEAYFKEEPLSERKYALHLAGEKGLGVCPIFADSTCLFGTIDIDAYSANFNGLLDAIYENNLPLFPCASKSGGLHIYLFLKKKAQASSVIKILERVVSMLGLRQTYGDKHVEVFPKQAKLTPGTKGSCITIPYYNADEPVSWLWSPEHRPMAAEEAVNAMRRGKSSVTNLSESLDALELSDAPCCIQTVIVSSALDKDSGRNNFLFTCAVYLKKKFGEDFKSQLEEFNARLSAPVTDKEIEAIYQSVKANEYNYKCKDIPCRSYCDRANCAKREFGVGKDKGYFTGIEYGKLTRMMAEEPYYIWELKKQGDDNFVKINFKDETSLMDQKFFAKMCIRYLNHTPFTMQNNEWYKVLNTVMPQVEEVAVPKSTDTSERAEIREAFVKFLTQKQAGMNMPVQIKMGFVYRNCTKYYFTHRGFEQFLDVERIKLSGENLRELLLLYGAKNDILKYSTKSGTPTEVPCWSREVDEELKEIEDYYSDVFEADADILQMTLDSDKEGDANDDEALF